MANVLSLLLLFACSEEQADAAHLAVVLHRIIDKEIVPQQSRKAQNHPL